MSRYIPIHPKDKTFARLLGDVRQGLKEDNQELIEKAKAEFAEANITLFYNQERKLIRVLQQGGVPIDFPL